MKKHIAKRGFKAGQWVDCDAEMQCRNGGEHIETSTLIATQRWLTQIMGYNVPIKTISYSQVLNFTTIERMRKTLEPNYVPLENDQDFVSLPAKTKSVKERLNDMFSGWSVKEVE